MNEQERHGAAAGDPAAQDTTADDPTAQWLASVRPGPTPWRTERPAVEHFEHLPPEPVVHEPTRWRRTRAVARAAGQAAPYVQTAALAGWFATSALTDEGDDAGTFDWGFDWGADTGFEA